MPNDVRWRAGSTVSTVTFGGTDAQFEAAILDFCEALGIDTTGNKQAILDRFTQHDYVNARAVARAHRKRKKQASTSAALEAELDAELGT